ncbi:EthD family reductase [Microbacterium aerolatum]|uniref:EthD family reductase n=1 Tax=Microbacterium aerolatum TaxID=153731 RepID=UPI00200132C9|nr:EthD family reductase [Microbacterium aerolatum]MCK3769478.1 EthD family reductase [Microbacterium aerolatum]
MPKRITYLTKRTDISSEQFREHWSTSHAAIAVDLPGVAAYRQNHVVHGTASRYGVDGIVELWFFSDEVVTAGIDSDVADRLVEDEPRFLSGLVGGAVRSGPPTNHWPIKAWALARWVDGEQPAEVVEWAAGIADDIGAAGHGVNVTDVTGPHLVREALEVNPEPPEVAVTFGFSSCADVEQVRSGVAAAAEKLDVVTGVDVLIVEERIII